MAFSSLGTVAVKRIKGLIAPTSKSAVAQVNDKISWGPTTFSRDGFSQVTDPGITGSDSPGGTVSWDRSSPNCGPGVYEVVTRDSSGTQSDEVAFFTRPEGTLARPRT